MYANNEGRQNSEFLNQNCVLAHLNNAGSALEASYDQFIDYSMDPNPIEYFNQFEQYLFAALTLLLLVFWLLNVQLK